MVLIGCKDNKDIKEIGMEIYHIIKEECMTNCFIGIGRELDKTEDISSSYERIELLIEKRFYNTDEYIFSDEDFSDSHVISKDDTDRVLKEIKQDINIKDINSLKINIKSLFDIYEKENDFSNMYVKFIFSNVLKDLYDNISESDEENFKYDIDKLYRSEDFSKVVKIINTYFEKFEKSI